MRTVYLRFREYKNFKVKKDALNAPQGCGVMVNRRGASIILQNSKLRRSIVNGITLLDEWGIYDKWFTDDDVSRTPLF